ncbi:SCO family protein [Tenacibaculum sp. Bg11-29]|uniref:SCO family protein n=1 Tax=Tenacibaculum sp. Bg11-29 TaxID=2058306 RepID=UPI000C3393CE|nr:SCO family protein [Tenacibaculum sp. Bg11-29]PKH51192.1 SCO family protein [Tenacibaculum sp. Bg11-29]
MKNLNKQLGRCERKEVIFTLLVLMLVFASCKRGSKVNKETTLPFFNSAEFTPEWIAKGSSEYNYIHTVPDFNLINQEGKTITKQYYKDKIYVTDFFFATCPGICPILEKNMSKLQEKFKNDSNVLLLSHTVMPVKDSVSVLKKYALDNEIVSGKWNLVTGDKKQIYNLARKGYFADEDFGKTQDEDAFIHTENFILVDKKGRIRGVYNGTLALETKRLIRHIEILKKEG